MAAAAARHRPVSSRSRRQIADWLVGCWVPIPGSHMTCASFFMSCPSLSAMTVHLVAALLAAALVTSQPGAVHGAAAAAAASGPRIWRPLTPTKPAAAAATGTPTDDDGDSDHACSFFLWDVPSLIKYKMCEHLLRHNVYEARGGKKMVRIRPGSALQWLYPLSRHAPDRCALCGHSFEDHLRRWWEEKGQVGTAFDRALDETYNEGVSVVHLDGAAASGSNDAKRPHYRVFSFHRRYVEDIPKKISTARKVKSIKGRIVAEDDGSDKYEKYTRGPVPYRIPQFSPEGINSLWKALVLLLARNMAIDEVDTLIELETKENRLLEKRANLF